MVGRIDFQHIRVVAALFAALAVSNCGVVSSDHNIDGASGLEAICAQDLQSTFALSYYPLVTTGGLCIQCHSDSGPSPYKFAASDPSSAYSAFMQVGADQVDQKAVDPSHAAGVTGPTLQPRITAARAMWDPAMANYQSCLGSTSSGALVMADRNTPDLYFGDGRTDTLTWSTSSSDITPAGARFPGTFMIDVKVNYQTVGGASVATGYVFTKPRLQMLTGESEVAMQAVIIYINGVQAKGIEPFLSAQATAKGIDPVTIYNGSVQVDLPGVSSGDKIGVGFGYFNLRPRTDNPPTPPAPTVSANNPYTSKTQVPITVGGDSTARRWCLTASSVKPSSTAVACPGFENSLTTNGWLTARPTIFDLTTIGQTVTSGQTVQFYLWVANSDLKISASPGTSQVTFDSTAPAAPAVGSVSVTDTQIADILGLQDSNEPVSWCAIENATLKNVQSSNSCSFTAAKPTYIGLAGGGTRYVGIFVKDRAGNITPAAVQTVNNPFGLISFAQLTDATQGNRAVFANRCVSCHGAGGAQQSFWDETSYADTVAKKALISGRIDNATQPMPPTGLIDVKERALIHLWFNQTSTPVQL